MNEGERVAYEQGAKQAREADDKRVVELTTKLAETVEKANGLEKLVEQLKAEQVALATTIRVLSKVLPP